MVNSNLTLILILKGHVDFFDFFAIFSGFGRRSRKPRYVHVHLFK